MKKIFLLVLLVAVVLITLLIVRNMIKKLDVKSLPGELIMNGLDAYNKGLIRYEPRNGRIDMVENELNYSSPVYSANKDKILAVEGGDKITEYQIQEGKKNMIESLRDPAYVKYIPNSSKISFVSSGELFIYDKISKNKTLITEVAGDYSWSKEGKSFLFCKERQDAQVLKYDIETGSINTLFKGYNPVYSNDNRKIAYVLYSTDKDVLVIRDIDTGKEWKHKANGISFYRFSPDDKYIAISQAHQPWNFKYLKGGEILVWDYEKSKTGFLIEHIDNSTEFDWK
jgi:hypothetical protein